MADRAGIELSDWEGEFLESVTERVKTYGRAFGDPDKGAPGTPLSVLQGVKLKEISAKAQGKGTGSGRSSDRPGRKAREGFGRSRRKTPKTEE